MKTDVFAHYIGLPYSLSPSDDLAPDAYWHSQDKLGNFIVRRVFIGCFNIGPNYIIKLLNIDIVNIDEHICSKFYLTLKWFSYVFTNSIKMVCNIYHCFLFISTFFFLLMLRVIKIFKTYYFQFSPIKKYRWRVFNINKQRLKYLIPLKIAWSGIFYILKHTCIY